MSVDLRKLRKNPLAPVPQPMVAAAPPPPAAPAAPPSAHKSPVLAASAAASLPNLPPKPKRKKDWPWMAYVVGVVILGVLLAGGHYIYRHYWSKSPFGPTPTSAAEQAAAAAPESTSETSEADIVSKVGKLMLLPEGEAPALAKVSDLAALQDQVFFKNAKIGDIVLMYGKAARAILYDPLLNKIIEVGPIQNATTTNAI